MDSHSVVQEARRVRTGCPFWEERQDGDGDMEVAPPVVEGAIYQKPQEKESDMVRECRYLGDNAEQLSPSQQRVRPDDFDAHWPSSHRPDGFKEVARRRRRERKRKNSNDAQRDTQD